MVTDMATARKQLLIDRNGKFGSWKLGAFVFIVLGPVLAPTDGRAAELNAYEVFAGAAYTDNLWRSEDNAIEETIGILGVRLDASHETSRFSGSIAGDLQYRAYKEDSAENEDLGAITASVDFGIVENAFDWVATLDYGTIISDPFLPSTPENRQNINVISTGPDFRIRLGANWRFELSGRYTGTDFEVSDDDNVATSGRVGLVRAMSPNRSLSLNLATVSYEFDDLSVNRDFDLHSAYLSLISNTSKSDLQVDLGVTELEADDESYDDWMGRISLNRRLSSISALRLSYNKSINSAGSFFQQINDPSSRPGGAQGIGATSDPFLSQTAILGFDYDRNRSTAYLSGEYRDFDYASTNEYDRSWVGLRAGFRRSFSTGFTTEANVEFAHQTFDVDGREDDDQIYRLGIRYRLGRLLSVGLDYMRWKRDSSTDGFSYSENQYFLSFRMDNEMERNRAGRDGATDQ